MGHKFYYINSFLCYQIDEISKHSKNVIDLIEVGDYVNGYEVLQSKYTYMDKNFIDFEPGIDAGSGYGNALWEKDIDSIVTHEQFNSIKYVIGE